MNIACAAPLHAHKINVDQISGPNLQDVLIPFEFSYSGNTILAFEIDGGFGKSTAIIQSVNHGQVLKAQAKLL